MSRAFFVKRSRNLDVSPVKEYGQPVYLLDQSISPFRTNECLSHIIRALTEHNYQPGEDYIAIGGPSILTALMMSVASNVGPVRALLWDAPGERYIERMFQLTTEKEDWEIRLC